MKSKRIIGLLLISLVIHIFSPCYTAIAAEGTLSISTVNGVVGDEVAVTVSIIDNPGIAAFKVDINYDNEKLLPVSIIKGSALTVGTITSNLQADVDLSSLNCVTALWVNLDNLAEDGDLFIVTFIIKEGAVGFIPLTLSYDPGNISNQIWNDVDLSVLNGSINVASDDSDVGGYDDDDDNDNNNNMNLAGNGSGYSNTKDTKTNTEIVTGSPEVPKDSTNDEVFKVVERNFEDLSNHQWAAEAITVLADNRILYGTSDTTFEPNASIKRADYILLLVRMLGLMGDAEDNFNDVLPYAYYYQGVGLARLHGLTEGVGENNFEPEKPITRQDMFVLAYRIMKMHENVFEDANETYINQFDDYSSIADYAKIPLATLVSNGLVQGDINHIYPQDNATRAEAAVFIYRLLK